MKTMIRLLPVIALLVALGSPVLAAAPPAPYFNGFEKNTAGWYAGGGYGTITRTGRVGQVDWALALV